MKFLVFGLGNIGSEYENTRHNIGFYILDAFAKASNVVFESSRYASVASVAFKGRTIILVKPSTYMNLSGKAVNYWMHNEKVSIENILVVLDDLAIPFGTIRLKKKGTDGGHNGLKNINLVLGQNDYSRLRFGIGDNFSKGRQIDYVLGGWTRDEILDLPERTDKCIEAIKCFATQGIDKAMSDYNNK